MKHMTPTEIDAYLKTIPKDEILGIEAKHITYCNSNVAKFERDTLITKEIIHLKNGESYPTLSRKDNYKRPFYITKKIYRNHKDKKQQEYLSKLDKFETIQCKLESEIARILKKERSSLKRLARSQYLYGCDIRPETLRKYEYQQRWPNLFKTNTLAVLDFETDMLTPGRNKDPIIGTITYKDRAITCILESWINHIPDYEKKIRKEIDKAIGHITRPRNVKFEILTFKTKADLCLKLIDTLHLWQPDLVGIWNIDFDISVFIETLTEAGVDLGNVFSDPRVPNEYKYFYYKKGPTTQRKDDGTEHKLQAADQWHTVYTPASFYFIDGMSVYRQIRKAQGREKYGLDDVMDKNLDLGKLYYEFDDVGPVGTVDWHIGMQKHHRIEYIVYNIFDCIGFELLDEKTKDLCTQLSVFSGYSHYSIFNSNPKQTSDELHFLCLDLETLGYDKPKVISSLSDNMVSENDRYVLGKEDNIVTLPSYTTMIDGLAMIKEFPNIKSSIVVNTSDADLAATYPTGNIIQNLDGETQMVEVCRIEGLTSMEQRELGLDITGGPSNALVIAMETMNFPHPDDLLDLMLKECA